MAVRNLPWLALRGDAFARDEAILNQLSAIVMTTAGAFETTQGRRHAAAAAQGVAQDAVMIDAALAADRNGRSAPPPGRHAREHDAAGAGGAPLGHARQRLSGRTSEGAEPIGDQAGEAKPEQPARRRRRSSARASRINVILVGDADMLMDRNWIQQQSLFGQQMARAFANNGDFVINAIEQMAGGSALADLRGRGVSWRPFELIQRMEADAEQRYSAKEQELHAAAEGHRAEAVAAAEGGRRAARMC